jgi:SAM-dependent methyltransferase
LSYGGIMAAVEGLISHHEVVVSLDETKKAIAKRIIADGDKEYAPVEHQLALLEALAQFDFGRFLIQNRGINGYWTHYLLTHPQKGRKTGLNNRGQLFTDLESFILDDAPTMLATQERFDIFLKQNQQCVKEGASLCCVPSGLMAELLYLDYSTIETITLKGIDLDAQSLEQAMELAQEKGLEKYANFKHLDAWTLDLSNAFDLISCNGLTIYEPNNTRVALLFQRFYQALKPGAKFVTSFLTPPPGITDSCEWQMDEVDSEYLLLQRMLFIDVLNAKFQCYRSSIQIKQQLQACGFKHIEFFYDKAHIFPTVVATK